MANINSNDVKWDSQSPPQTSMNSISPSQVTWDSQQTNPTLPSSMPFEAPSVTIPSDEPSPLNFFQNLMMGLMPDDKTRMRYLDDKFQGANISQDENGGITIDGARINPEGFDFGDIIRNAGYAIPLIGQIGATTGAGLTAAPTGPGAIGAAMLAGGVGAIGGDVVRLGLGKLGGAPTDLPSATQSGITEGVSGALGEGIVGGAILGANKSGVITQLGKMWQNIGKKFGEATPDVLHYLGNIDKDAVKKGQQVGWNIIATDKYLDPEKTLKIAKNTLLGNEAVPAVALDRQVMPNLTMGQKLLADSIRATDNEGYDQLVKTYGKSLSDDTIGVIKSEGSKLFKPEYFGDRAALSVADEILQKSEKNLSRIGQELSKIESKSIRAEGKLPFAVSDIGKNIEQFRRARTGELRVPGFQAKELPSSPGVQALNKVEDLFKGTISKGPNTGKRAFYGEVLKDQRVMEPLTTRQALKVRHSLDEIVHDVANNKRISGDIKRQIFETAKEYRTRLHEHLKTGDIAKQYSELMDFYTDSKINPNRIGALENTIENFSSQSEATKESLGRLVNSIPDGDQIVAKVKRIGAARELGKVNTSGMVEALRRDLSADEFLKGGVGSLKEEFLKGIDNSLSQFGNKIARNRIFLEDAERSLAAKKLLGGSSQLLRIQSLSNILGLGALGFSGGGPIGAAAGGIGALAISNPKTLVGIMKRLENRQIGRGSQRKLLSDILALAKRATPAIGAREISRGVSSSQSPLAVQQ